MCLTHGLVFQTLVSHVQESTGMVNFYMIGTIIAKDEKLYLLSCTGTSFSDKYDCNKDQDLTRSEPDSK